MATKRTSTKKEPDEARPSTPSEEVAFAIMARYRDLTPSVNRIMQARLTEEGRFRAITLFEQALEQPEDPMRDPAGAIAAGLAFES